MLSPKWVIYYLPTKGSETITLEGMESALRAGRWEGCTAIDVFWTWHGLCIHELTTDVFASTRPTRDWPGQPFILDQGGGAHEALPSLRSYC